MATINRQANPAPVTLKIKFKSETLTQFVERYAADISHGGIFVRTKEPLPVGTLLRFEFQLKDASPLIAGEGTVVWIREADARNAAVAPGMGVRFDKLPGENQGVLDKILAHKAKTGAAAVDAGDQFREVPTRVVAGDMLDAVDTDARKTLMGIGKFHKEDQTPLPRPATFASDADEFPDEAFEEATKVASLDALARQSAESEPPPVRTDAARPALAGIGAPKAEPVAAAAPASAAKAEPARKEAVIVRKDAAVVELSSRRPVTRDPNDARSAPAEAEAASRPPSPLASGTNQRLPSVVIDDRAETVRMDDEPTTASVPVRAAAKTVQPNRADTTVADDDMDDVIDRGPSSVPWIAAAAVLLAAAGAVGFWLLNQDRPATAPSATAAGLTETTSAGSTEAVAAAPPTAPPAAVATGSLTIEVEPAGATVELVGTGRSAPAPATFKDLTPGTTFTVRATMAGHRAKDLELTATAEGVTAPRIVLEPKPRVLRIASTLYGAAVTLAGKRRGVTPIDLPLDAAAKNPLSLTISKAGFQSATLEVDLNAVPAEDGEQVVYVVKSELVAQAPMAVARRPQPPRPAPAPTPVAETPTEPAATPTPPTDEPTETDLSAPPVKPAATDKPAAQPVSGKPPAATDKPAAQPPAAQPPKPINPPTTPTHQEPTPDWLGK